MSENPPSGDPLDTHTRRVGRSSAAPESARCVALTILGHSQANRIGERALLRGLANGESVAVSRAAPLFEPPAGGASRPLADPFLSRAALVSVRARDGGIVISRERADVQALVDGADLARSQAIDAVDLERGVTLELEGRCAILLHLVESARSPRAPGLDLVGESDAIERLRRDVARVAVTDMRVLLRGESGSGKELVARAIHAESARRRGPHVAVDTGTITPTLAASALFGHVRGAFSGALADHEGHFLAAHGGTLFLDEVGDADPVVQSMLLRALEAGEVQRVGEKRARRVDVRVVSATDADLEEAMREGRFREPLLHRLAEITLRVPPLRERRDDIGRLTLHFLRELLRPEEQARLLEGQLSERPWLSAAAMARLARAPWSGNVRQLRNVVRQMVLLCRDEPEMRVLPELEASLRAPVAEVEPKGATGPFDDETSAARPRGKRPQDLTEEEILDALRKTGFRRAAAADLLGIARSSLFQILAATPSLQPSRELSREELQAVFERHGGDVAGAAAELQISEHGLKLRLRALGLLRSRRA